MALSDLVVKIGSDAKNFNRGVEGIKSSIGGLKRFALGAAGAMGVAFSTNAAIQAAREQAKAEAKLGAVLKATGNAAGFTAGELKKQAAALQSVSNFGDEAVINAQSMLLTFKEIKGDNFTEAMKAAADMSSVLDTDLKSSVLQIGKALNDPIKGMSALTRSGVSFTEAQKEQVKALQESGDLMGAQKVILDELKGEFGGAAEAMADPWTQLSNILGDMLEPIGQLITDTMKWGLEAFNVMEVFGSMIEWIQLTIDYGKFMATNWQTVMDLIGSSFMASILLMVDRVKWFFLDLIPSFLSWFMRNWQQVFIDIGNFTMTVFKNLAENIKNLMSEVWDYIESGGEDAISFNAKGLLEGFKSSVQEAYELPEFQAGQMTQRWVDRAAAGAEELDRKWTENRLAKQAEEMAEANKKLTETGGPAAASKTDTKKTEDKFAGAMEQGSVEAYRTLMRRDTPQVKEQQKTNQILNQMNQKMTSGAMGQPVLEAF